MVRAFATSTASCAAKGVYLRAIHEEHSLHLNNNVGAQGNWLAFGGRGTYNPQTGN